MARRPHSRPVGGLQRGVRGASRSGTTAPVMLPPAVGATAPLQRASQPVNPASAGSAATAGRSARHSGRRSLQCRLQRAGQPVNPASAGYSAGYMTDQPIDKRPATMRATARRASRQSGERRVCPHRQQVTPPATAGGSSPCPADSPPGARSGATTRSGTIRRSAAGSPAWPARISRAPATDRPPGRRAVHLGRASRTSSGAAASTATSTICPIKRRSHSGDGRRAAIEQAQPATQPTAYIAADQPHCPRQA